MIKSITSQATGISSGELEADQFRVGDVWQSPRGVRYTVFRVSNGVAHMVNENTQRTANRAYNDLGGAGRGWRPWVRISSGKGENQ
jgi:hypothetical protein